MHGYSEVNWDKANCGGMSHTLFYVFEEPKQPLNTFYDVSIVKSVCYSCPIWRQCLDYGIANEDFGVWGGLTTRERDSLIAGEPSSVFTRVAQELLDNGIGITEILEIVSEHSRYERSMAHEVTY